MANPELGSKQVCPNCQAKFYDLTRRPAHCPKCHHEFDPEEAVRTRRVRARAAPVDHDTDDEMEDQVVAKPREDDEDEEDEGEDLIGGDGKRRSAIDRVVEAAAALGARLGSALPDAVAEINARLGLSVASAEIAPEKGAAAPDAMDGSVRALPPDQQTPSGPRFCADLDINDYSAHARGRAISRPALAAIADVSRAAVLVRGAWAERAPRGSASRLHAHVEGPDARSVEAAVAELRRVLDEASADVSSGRV